MTEVSRVLARLTAMATTGLDLAELLPDVVDTLQVALGGAEAIIYLLDRERDYLVAQHPDRRMVSPGEGEVGRAWETGAVQYAGSGGRLAMPLIVGGNVLGVLEIQPAQDRIWDETAMLLLQAAVGQVALAVENARLREENTGLTVENERLFKDGLQLVGELSALNEVIQSLNTELELDKLLTVIHRQASRVMDAKNFYIALSDQENQQIAFPFCVDQGQQVQVSPRPFGQGRTEWIIRTGEPLFWRASDPKDLTGKELPVSPQSPGCYLGVPLVVGEWVFGVMAMQSYDREDVFEEKDLRLLVTIAAQAGVAISNARLFEETQAALSQLQEAYKTQEALAATVRELSAPVVQIWEDVLALPLVGAIDAARAQRITENLLQGINRHHAKAVIIDVTGVPIVDSSTAHHLLQAIRAAELLGAHCILTGISADVAQAMVSAGVKLTGVTTLVDLQAGMRYVMAERWRETARFRGGMRISL
jgi:anti-anti-sigma factor